MTKITTLFLLLFSTALFGEKHVQFASQVNDTESYFGSISCWSYKANFYEPIISGYRIGTASYSMQGDTIINNFTYKKMHFGIGTYDSKGVNDALIRQENQKVYAITKDQQGEFLFYDFSVQVGDQIISNALYGEISRLPKVSNVDFVTMYNGEKRKRINVGGDVWIEGIGSINGFMQPIREYLTCDCNSSYTLIAFTKEYVLKFYDSALCLSFNCCTGITDEIGKVVETKNSYTLSPNPVSDRLFLNTETEVADCTIELFDIQGKLVLQKQINSFQNSIHLSSFRNGLYIYRLIHNGELLKVGKIVKQE